MKWWHTFMWFFCCNNDVFSDINIYPTLSTCMVMGYLKITTIKNRTSQEKLFWNIHLSWYANFCDKLLVETDIFDIFGVSFCVTQNTFNFIGGKKNIGEHFRKYYITLCWTLNVFDGVVGSVHVAIVFLI